MNCESGEEPKNSLMAAVTGRILISALRRYHVEVLDGHALTDDALHAGEADADLVLEQLAYAAQTAVAQMVDVVYRADAVAQVKQVADGGEHIVDDDGLRDEVIVTGLERLLELLALYAGVDDLLEDGEADLLLDAELFSGACRGSPGSRQRHTMPLPNTLTAVAVGGLNTQRC